MTARPLYKLDHTITDKEQVARLKRRLEVERRLRRAAEARAVQAEANSKRFHALLIQARVELINRGDR
jgi:hypothetical protein